MSGAPGLVQCAVALVPPPMRQLGGAPIELKAQHAAEQAADRAGGADDRLGREWISGEMRNSAKHAAGRAAGAARLSDARLSP